jgi:acylglycerol lipase
MRHFELGWQTADRLQIYSQGWEPESEIQAVVCLVHGLGEHSGRYKELAERLNQEGYVLMGFDLRGHGKSQGPRGHTPNFESFMQDISQFLEQAARRYPQKPIFLYGHSLGGILVLNYALREKPKLSGVIATGAGLRTALEKQHLKIAFARLAGAIAPQFSLPSGLGANMISRDAAIVQAYRDDPLVHDRATLRMANESFRAISWAFEHVPEFPPVPLLLMHGTGDQLAYYQGSQEFALKVPGDCTLKLWDGLYHEIHNEPEKSQVFDYLIGWLNEKCSSRS